MVARVLAREPLPDHGELRAYRLEERDEILLEVLREADGRAWQLRVPVAERGTLRRLAREAARTLRAPDGPVFDGRGTALLGSVRLGAKDELAALAMREGEEQALALWRRECLRTGWSWTIDLVLVPMPLGPTLCGFVQDAVGALD